MRILLSREWKRLCQRDVCVSLGFFTLALFLFPLALGPQPELLHSIGPGIIWVVAILSLFIHGDSTLKEDYKTGALDQLALYPYSPFQIFISKALTSLAVNLMPLLCLSIILSPFFHLSLQEIILLIITLAIGLPALTFLTLFGATLTLTTRSGGTLIMLLTLPLFIPILIFAHGAIEASQNHLPITPHLFLLAGTVCIVTPLACLFGSLSLRQAQIG